MSLRAGRDGRVTAIHKYKGRVYAIGAKLFGNFSPQEGFHSLGLEYLSIGNSQS